MAEKRHKIPLLLKLKRIKNSKPVERLNTFFSYIKPSRSFKGVPKRILLIRNDRIGDAVVTLPVIRDIKLNYPYMKIDVLVSQRNKFVFKNLDYINEVIEFNWTPDNLRGLYKLPLLGGIFQFLRYALLPYMFSTDYRKKIKQLKEKKYDGAADLVGLKRNAILCKLVANFSIGPKKLLTYVLYDFYIDSNWVALNDNDFMAGKIENALASGLSLNLEKRDTSLPLTSNYLSRTGDFIYDVFFHLGSTQLRKLDDEKEESLVEHLSEFNVLVTDKEETENFIRLKKKFAKAGKIKFKIFSSLEQATVDCIKSRLLACYDGGQAHYLSQFSRTITIFGPGSVALWRPYEFARYSLLEKDINGTEAVISSGAFKHIAIYHPIWCSPCFDIGCGEKPCLGAIRAEFILHIIKKYCSNAD
ncbi:MAG: hypothetical protein L0Y79_09450 [Chlorobi bacterium]|nr:hypothetical protein [Chlorobiota bacterium]MCI0715144.1 hypothetical protein [Chlorobiota bacterium]